MLYHYKVVKSFRHFEKTKIKNKRKLLEKLEAFILVNLPWRYDIGIDSTKGVYYLTFEYINPVEITRFNKWLSHLLNKNCYTLHYFKS